MVDRHKNLLKGAQALVDYWANAGAKARKDNADRARTLIDGTLHACPNPTCWLQGHQSNSTAALAVPQAEGCAHPDFLLTA
jgi:hypothetical protein